MAAVLLLDRGMTADKKELERLVSDFVKLTDTLDRETQKNRETLLRQIKTLLNRIEAVRTRIARNR